MTRRTELLPGVFLTAVQDRRFKTACFSLSFLRPLRVGEAAMNALLPSVLLRGSKKTPSIRAIADRLDDLHGASVGALVRKKGEVQLTGLFADCLEDQYAGETVFLQLLDFVSELLFCPQMENSAFLPQLVQQERQNLQNAMQSVLDDKGAYCERQMLRSMCRGERYACGRLGEPEELDAIDARTLWRHYACQGIEPCQANADAGTRRPQVRMRPPIRLTSCKLSIRLSYITNKKKSVCQTKCLFTTHTLLIYTQGLIILRSIPVFTGTKVVRLT